MIKRILLLFFIIYLNSCEKQNGNSDLVYDCINKNISSSLIDVKKGDVFDLFNSIESDLLIAKIIHSSDKVGYIKFLVNINNKELIREITTIMNRNFNQFSKYPNAIMNVGTSFTGCLDMYEDRINIDMRLLLDEYKNTEVNKNFNIESIETLTNNLTVGFFSIKENRYLLLYLILFKVYYFKG